jgi:hypothetical protein
MITFISKKDFNSLVNELLFVKSNLIKVTNEVNLLKAQVLELNLKRPVVLSSTSHANRSSITVTAKPKRGRPFGSTNKSKK